MSFTRLALIGPPASGKGTQCSLLAQQRGLLHLSTGHLIREEVERGTELGRRAAGLVNHGQLLDDQSVLGLVRGELDKQNFDHYLLDGFPRTIAQAEAFEKICSELGRPLQRVVLLDVPENLLLERALNRATCPSCGHTMGTAGSGRVLECPQCGEHMERREDDSRETFARRMEAYHAQVNPLIEFYRERELLLKVEAGASSVEEVTERIVAIIEGKSNPSL